MKKLLCLFGFSLLMMTSCANDETSINLNLPKKIIEIDTDGTTYTSVLTYDGNKIVSLIDDDGDKTNYIYTGDLITKIIEEDKEDGDQYVTEYEYTNGKMVSFVESEPDSDYKYKTVYTHNSDGTIFYKELEINITNDEETENSTGILTFNAGNLIKDVKTMSSGSVYTVTYEYDDQNNPTKNILGFNYLLNNEQLISVNNVVKSTEIESYSGETYTYESTYIYTYDSKGFPKEAKEFYGDDVETMKYVY